MSVIPPLNSPKTNSYYDYLLESIEQSMLDGSVDILESAPNSPETGAKESGHEDIATNLYYDYLLESIEQSMLDGSVDILESAPNSPETGAKESGHEDIATNLLSGSNRITDLPPSLGADFIPEGFESYFINNSFNTNAFNPLSEEISEPPEPQENLAESLTDKQKLNSCTKKLYKALKKTWFQDTLLDRVLLNTPFSSTANHFNSEEDAKINLSLMQPFEDFLNEYPDSPHAEKAVCIVLQHFQIIPMHSQHTPKLNTLYDNQINTLNDRDSNEAFDGWQFFAPTFVSWRKTEFKTYIENIRKFPEERGDIKIRICFVVAQDGDKARVYPLEVHVDAWQQIRSINEIDSEDEKLLSLLPYMQEMEESETIGAKLSPERLEKLMAKIETLDGESIPLVLKFQKPYLSGEESISDFSDDEAMEVDADEDKSSTRQHNDDRFGNRTGKAPALPRQNINRKRKAREIGKKSGVKGYKEIGEQHNFNPESSLHLAKKRRTEKKAETELLPNKTNATTFNSEEVNAPAFNPLSLWKSFGTKTLSSLLDDVRAEKSRRQALRLEPLSYPILKNLRAANIENIDSFTSLHPCLKPYQRKLVAKWLAFSQHGLSPILAAEMGLGKTLMAGELFLQFLSNENNEGLYFFVGPKSTTTQSFDRLYSFISEAQGLAWIQLWKEGEIQNDEFKNHLEKILDKSKSSHARACLMWKHILPLLVPYWNSELTTEKGRSWLVTHSNLISNINKSVITEVKNDLEKQDSLTDLMKDSFTEISDWTSLGSIEFGANSLKILYPYMDIDPNTPQTIPKEKAKRLIKVSLNNFYCCSERASLENTLKEIPDSTDASIIVTTPDAIKDLDLSKFHGNVCRHICLDEAQISHNNKSGINKKLKNLFKALKNEAKSKELSFSILEMTGTPIENNLAELWTLLQLGHTDELFPKEIFNAINTTIIDAESHLHAHASNKRVKTDINNSVIRSFAQLYTFKRVTKQLVLLLKKNSPEVHHDWKGAISEVIHKPILGITNTTFQERLTTLIKEKESEITTPNNNLLRYQNELLKAQLGLPEDADSNANYYTKIYKEAKTTTESNSENSSHIGKSPLLLTLFQSKAIRNAIDKKQRMLIAINHKHAARCVQALIKGMQKQTKNYRRCDFFHGDVDADQRSSILSRYKNKRGSCIVMTPKTGSTGLDLPETYKIFNLCSFMNPKMEQQLYARGDRVGRSGKLRIYKMTFNTDMDAYLKTLCDKKDTLEEFIFLENSNLKTSFAIFCKYLEYSVKQKLITGSKDPALEDIIEPMARVESLLDSLKNSLDEAYLSEIIAKVSPSENFTTPMDSDEDIDYSLEEGLLPINSMEISSSLPATQQG